jgi:ATP synthase F1 epsilon subunit
VVGIPAKPTLRVELLTPRSKLLDCRVESVIIPCSDGMRGILHHHCPFLSSLSLGIMQVQGISDKPDRPNAWYLLEGGFACLSEDHLNVLTYEVITFEGLDTEKAQQIISQAQNALANLDSAKETLSRKEITRNRMIIRMAEMASLITSGT